MDCQPCALRFFLLIVALYSTFADCVPGKALAGKPFGSPAGLAPYGSLGVEVIGSSGGGCLPGERLPVAGVLTFGNAIVVEDVEVLGLVVVPSSFRSGNTNSGAPSDSFCKVVNSCHRAAANCALGSSLARSEGDTCVIMSFSGRPKGFHPTSHRAPHS